MIINDREITGIFRYNSGSTYTEGDLILKGTSIYIAKTKVSGIDPEEGDGREEKYELYPGIDKYATIDQFLNYMNTGNPSDDKYISVSSLPIILNHYLTGVNEKGMIEDLEYNSSETEGDVSRVVADEILFDPLINHAMYTVTRNMEGLPLNVYSREYVVGQPDKLILKQYTYTQKMFSESVEELHRMRVQELIDHTQYMVWYRSVDLDATNINPTPWKSITLNMTNIHDRIMDLVKDYKDRINALQTVINELRRNFKYRAMNSGLNSNVYTIPLNYIDKVRLTAEIKWQDTEINGFYRKTEITIDLSSNIEKYISDGIYIKVTKNNISLYSDSGFKTPHPTAKFDNVYIHEFYG